MRFVRCFPAAAILIVFSSVACNRKPAYEWHTLVAPDGTFSVSLPGDATVADSPTKSVTGGSFISHTFNVRASTDAVYGCSWWEDPSRPRDQSAEKTLDIARDGGLLSTSATLLSENNLTFRGHPARDVRAIARGNAAYDNRIVVVGNRLYTLLVIDASGKRDDENIGKFFNSLDLR